MLLLIDNYDSFTYNLYQYFCMLGEDVLVKRHDEISITDIESIKPKYLVISPGPCTPNEAGISLSAIKYFAGILPILGVCLGHQAIAQVFGGKIASARQVMHGKTSLITHNRQGLFTGLKQPLSVTRYHSLIVEQNTLPDCFDVTAWCHNDGYDEIMAIKHKTLFIQGVQFHPESILSEQGLQLLKNFLLGY